jgi:hypothetical protein
VQQNSFENRTKQRSGRARNPGQTDASQFERKGIVGDWRNVFSPEAARLFDQFEGPTLVRLKYEPDSSWAHSFVSAERSA